MRALENHFLVFTSTRCKNLAYGKTKDFPQYGRGLEEDMDLCFSRSGDVVVSAHDVVLEECPYPQFFFIFLQLLPKMSQLKTTYLKSYDKGSMDILLANSVSDHKDK